MDSEDIVRLENVIKKGAGSEIRKKFIPDPDPGGKKAPDPGSATLVQTVRDHSVAGGDCGRVCGL
jgi:hypothetical protein